ncbi:AbrB/MazE/SpoVT family DNA-binding domain-containing protein [Actinopolyspora mortivallis]|uniref:AbrB/MazE/SpoVT family DNA-binding domain-containing protein n=1 Tax=Actinopolyspora mortivallis TaxID=33906 RepID=UPI000684DF68|nr:AbrB/MazE/SpoVT family DNA-binding domain-containing protein [Actinopolyspora mortivallis]
MTRIAGDQTCGVIHANGQGRVTIPSPLRRATGVEPGTPLAVYEEDGRAVIETRAHLAERIRRDVAEAWTGEGSAVDELIADRRAESARDDAEEGS